MVERRIGSSSLLRLLGDWRSGRSREAAYRQLAAALRMLILDGRMALEVRLPGERELAAALGLSRGTVTSAYADLRTEGYLAGRHGSGSVVVLPGHSVLRRTQEPNVDLSIAAGPAGPEVHEAFVQALAHLPPHLASSGYAPFGVMELREAIATRYEARGLPTTLDEIMVVSGALAGLALLLRFSTGPGDRVVVDHPTYPLAIAAIRGASCRPVPVPLSEGGWDVDGLAATFAQTAPRLAYLIPDFHNPTGRCMDAATREAVVAVARRARTILVADETMVDLWYDDPPPPPLAAYDRDGHVVTLGSTGKSFWGGLRVGWIRAPARMIAALGSTREGVDLGTPILEQLAATHLLTNAEGQLCARRDELRRRRDAFVSHGQAILPDWRFPLPPGGLACWIELPLPVATLLATRTHSVGVRIAAGPHFGVDEAFERYVRVPFTYPISDSRDALERIAPVWRRLASERTSNARSPLV